MYHTSYYAITFLRDTVGRMAILIPIANQKGGCGKTTTAMNLAGGLHKAGYRVKVIDADQQASATAWSIAQGQNSLPFDVVPGRQFRGSATLDSDDCDIILFDCPPGMADAANSMSETQMLARKAIRSADAVIVPLRPSTLDFTACASFVRYLGKQIQPETKVLVLLNGVQHTHLTRQAPTQAAVLFGDMPNAHVLTSTIGLRVAIAEVSGSGQTIFDYRPGQEAANEYTKLTKEIIQWLSQQHAPTSASSEKNSAKPTSHSAAAA